jgi:hypothetical protein
METMKNLQVLLSNMTLKELKYYQDALYNMTEEEEIIFNDIKRKYNLNEDEFLFFRTEHLNY